MKIHIIALMLVVVMLSGSLHVAAQPVLGDSGTPVSDTTELCPLSNDCQDVIYVGNQFTSGTVPEGTHTSEILLHSDGTVDGTSTVDYKSNYVRLDIGFSTEQGADFSAYIDPCTDTPFEEPSQGRIYFINDASLVGDIYTTAPGSDATGTGYPSNPYATLKYVMENVPLSAGTTIYIDTGIYDDTFVDINVPDLMIKGAGSFNTIFDNNYTDNNEEDNTVSVGNIFMRIYADGLLLEGLTVREYNYTHLNDASGLDGKAISIKEAQCIIIDDIHITENTADISSGFPLSALMIYASSVDISNASVSSNFSSIQGMEGGGIDIFGYFDAANVSIYNTYISDNTNSRGGAGIGIRGPSNTYIENSTLSNNTSIESGGAIYISNYANLNINNSCISDNIVTNEYETFANGGGIYVGELVALNVYNTVFESNKAISDAPLQERRGGAICKGYYKEDLTTIKVEVCKFEKNEAGNGQHIYMAEARLDINETQFLPEVDAIDGTIEATVNIQNSGTPEAIGATINFINTNSPEIYATPSCVSTDCIADAGFDASICPGENAQIGAEGQDGLIYYWDPPTGLDDANIANPTANPSETTTYTLYVSGCGGYISQDEVTVYVASGEDIVFPSKNTILCGTNNTLLVEGGESYVWTPPTGLSCSDCPNPTVNITESTVYNIVVTDANGCEFEQSILVTVAGNIDVNITADNGNSSICPGQAVQLTATGATDYIWSPPYGLSNPNIANPIATPYVTTTYTVTGFQDDCEATSEITIPVMPEYAIHFSYAINGCTVSFEASAITLNSYEWVINNEVVSNENEFVYEFTTNGTYQVCLTVVGNCGEEVTVCETITVNECVCSE